MDTIDELATAFARLPGIGPRQAKRFVFFLLNSSESDRVTLSELIKSLGKDVQQCSDCMRFYNGFGMHTCLYCSDTHRDDTLLMIVEKDQDLAAVERAGTYKGRYFVLGGVLTLTGKGALRERGLVKAVEKRFAKGLSEIVLALSATSEGEYTMGRVREILSPWKHKVKISTLGRGLATGSELEYSDAETLRAALQNRHET